jgi:hypothetical protein
MLKKISNQVIDHGYQFRNLTQLSYNLWNTINIDSLLANQQQLNNSYLVTGFG